MVPARLDSAAAATVAFRGDEWSRRGNSVETGAPLRSSDFARDRMARAVDTGACAPAAAVASGLARPASGGPCAYEWTGGQRRPPPPSCGAAKEGPETFAARFQAAAAKELDEAVSNRVYWTVLDDERSAAVPEVLRAFARVAKPADPAATFVGAAARGLSEPRSSGLDADSPRRRIVRARGPAGDDADRPPPQVAATVGPAAACALTKLGGRAAVWAPSGPRVVATSEAGRRDADFLARATAPGGADGPDVAGAPRGFIGVRGTGGIAPEVWTPARLRSDVLPCRAEMASSLGLGVAPCFERPA